jgi:hypothetical protein
VWGVCVTNNNGFWIGWLDLLTLLYNHSQLQSIITVHNGCLRLATLLTGLRVSSLLRDWLGSDLRVSHFFSFRCPLLTLHSWTLNTLMAELRLTELSCESALLNWTNFQENRIQITISSSSCIILFYPLSRVYLANRWLAMGFRVCSTPRKQVLPNSCLAMVIFVTIRYIQSIYSTRYILTDSEIEERLCYNFRSQLKFQ